MLGSGIGGLLLYFIYFLIILPTLIIFSFFIPEMRKKCLRYSTGFTLLYLLDFLLRSYKSLNSDLGAVVNLLDISGSIFCLLSVVIFILSFLIIDDKKFKWLWWVFVAIIICNWFMNIYFIVYK